MKFRKIHGIGVDVLEISRVCDAHQRHGERFLKRIFTTQELAYCTRYRDPYPRFTTRFCAKEAVAKALSVGIGHLLSFHDVEVHNDTNGKPFIQLSDRAHRYFKRPQFHLSLSHSREYATAMVIVGL